MVDCLNTKRLKSPTAAKYFNGLNDLMVLNHSLFCALRITVYRSNNCNLKFLDSSKVQIASLIITNPKHGMMTATVGNMMYSGSGRRFKLDNNRIDTKFTQIEISPPAPIKSDAEMFIALPM
jgi:hypothetical protein